MPVGTTGICSFGDLLAPTLLCYRLFKEKAPGHVLSLVKTKGKVADSAPFSLIETIYSGAMQLGSTNHCLPK
jgi:hypothetical protein